MKQEGPVLDRLTRRLSECPAEFLEEPLIGGSGMVHADAVAADLILDLGGEPLDEGALEPFRSSDKRSRDLLRLVLIACWLLRDPWFLKERRFAPAALAWLREGLRELAAAVSPELFVSDPDRREELARRCLRALGLRPAGETELQSGDRLTTIDSVERAAVIRDMQEKQKRTRELRRKMQEQEAQEAAAKAGREW